MNISTDTRRLKVRLNDIQARLLFDKVIRPYRQQTDPFHYYSVKDKRYGVYLGHFPKIPYANYTTSLIFQGYSNDSPLLKAIFDIIPLERWNACEIHVALDIDKTYEQFHVVRPAKRADPTWYPRGLYLGGESSQTRLLIYDKKEQMMSVKHRHIDTLTRIELRYSFSPMKRISQLTVDDFAGSSDYTILTDVDQLPEKIRDIVLRLNRNEIQWIDLHWKMKKKIREYAATSEQGLNLHGPILSAIEGQDLKSFIYAPTRSLDELSS